MFSLPSGSPVDPPGPLVKGHQRLRVGPDPQPGTGIPQGISIDSQEGSIGRTNHPTRGKIINPRPRRTSPSMTGVALGNRRHQGGELRRQNQPESRELSRRRHATAASRSRAQLLRPHARRPPVGQRIQGAGVFCGSPFPDVGVVQALAPQHGALLALGRGVVLGDDPQLYSGVNVRRFGFTAGSIAGMFSLVIWGGLLSCPLRLTR